ncbi:hypothetical protein [Halobaculum litoreum]|uniref:Uncharacterized protein n=1 Tax=Halobaculum litoreum TaxID=3031998 RepID=A0ABD5XKA6_9EURY|nr:hypothetical protein [Halobaculum sp. DT92]
MPTESPPSLRESLRSPPGIAAAVAFVLLALYAVVIQSQILLVVSYVSLGLLLWLLYRFVRAHERIADAQARRAAAASPATDTDTDDTDEPAEA